MSEQYNGKALMTPPEELHHSPVEVEVSLRPLGNGDTWGGRVTLSARPFLPIDAEGKTYTLRLAEGNEAPVVIKQAGLAWGTTAGAKVQRAEIVGSGPAPF